MQKIIDSIITLFLGLVIGSLFFFVVQAKAETKYVQSEHSLEEYTYTRNPHSEEKSNVNTEVDDIINLILKQGFAGAIIVCLGIWTFRTDKMNRAMQKENFDKLAKISQDCSGHMAGVSARLENLEREVESMKQIELMKRS